MTRATARKPHALNQDPKWNEIDRQLIAWGEQLDELWTRSRDNPDEKRDELIMELETRYNAVRQDIMTLQEQNERASAGAARDQDASGDGTERLVQLKDDVSEKAREVGEQIKSEVQDLGERVRSGEALEDAKETAETLRIGAIEVGRGLSRAWGELRQSFDSAGEKMKSTSEKPEQESGRAASAD